MVGEIFQIYLPQIAKNALKLSTMVGETFEIYKHNIYNPVLWKTLFLYTHIYEFWWIETHPYGRHIPVDAHRGVTLPGVKISMKIVWLLKFSLKSAFV